MFRIYMTGLLIILGMMIVLAMVFAQSASEPERIRCEPEPFVDVQRCPGSYSLTPALACPEGTYERVRMFRCSSSSVANFATVQIEKDFPQAQMKK